MKIKNKNITIKPFSIEYTKERVEWEKKQKHKYELAVDICSHIIIGLAYIVFLYVILWTSNNVPYESDGIFNPILVVALVMVVIFVIMAFNDYGIKETVSILIKILMKRYYTPHHGTYYWDYNEETVFDIQEMWKQIAKSIKEGTAEVELSEENEEFSNRLRLVLKIKYED